ncbi:MAG: glycosyltransferase family 2 protein [Rikenellaceae bacterium]|nr:glycosyltransferase family 2 protein [Rikenellaceae bacterium]
MSDGKEDILTRTGELSVPYSSSVPDISVVVPVFNEEDSLPELVAWIGSVMDTEGYRYEIIFVDDGSTDSSWRVVRNLAAERQQVRGLSFRRNYGKSAALYTGFEAARGEVVITMDADLQDSPEEIPALYRMVRDDGYDLVSGWKKKRRDPLGKTLPSRLFNTTARWVSGIRLHDFNCGLKAYRRKVVKSIEVYGEMHRYIPILAQEAGFNRIGEKVVEHHPRKYGKTKFGLERMMRGYLDLISVTFITRFGKSPMYFFGGMGTLMFLVGGATAVWLIAEKIYRQSHGLTTRSVADQPLFFIALTAVILGVVLFLAGFLGELINRTSGERNKYILDETVGMDSGTGQHTSP